MLTEAEWLLFESYLEVYGVKGVQVVSSEVPKATNPITVPFKPTTVPTTPLTLVEPSQVQAKSKSEKKKKFLI